MGVVRMWSSTAIIVQACVIEIAITTTEKYITHSSQVFMWQSIGQGWEEGRGSDGVTSCLDLKVGVGVQEGENNIT